jgi:hypothetical protein
VSLGVACSRPKDCSPGNGRNGENLVEQKISANGIVEASTKSPRKQASMKYSLTNGVLVERRKRDA